MADLSYKGCLMVVSIYMHWKQGWPYIPGKQSMVLLFHFLIAQPLGWAITTFGLYVIPSVSNNLKPCDWSKWFMRVISLGLSSVNRFCSTDWDTAKCVKVVYRSVHICHSSRHKVVLRRNLMMIITMRMRLTKS